MRRALSVFLVLMLVLRGLLGDAMAMGLMAGGHAAADAPLQTSVAHAGMAHDALATHDMHAAAAANTHADAGSHADMAHASTPAHCASPQAADANSAASSDCDAGQHTHCSACGICHSPLGAAGSAALPAQAPAHAAPSCSLPALVSAALAQVAKPPIS